MGSYLLLFFVLFTGSNELVIDIPAPDHQIKEGQLSLEEGVFMHQPGVPRLPAKNLCLGLPPGAIVKAVRFLGERKFIGKADIMPAPPCVPLRDDHALDQIKGLYEQQKKRYYGSDRTFPQGYGALLSKGGLRKYTLVTVSCYHFAYQAVSKRLYCAPKITIKIEYTMPSPLHERAKFYEGLKHDVTLDETAQNLIYNWEEIQPWYETASPKKARGYLFIVPSALQTSITALADYRESQGYDVMIVTKEYIQNNVAGTDLQQKIRYYLRDNMADIAFALLVGFSTDLPWRSMVPFNNNPSSPYQDPDYSPIPSDLYYAELTDPDYLSWNSDGDDYYGEAYTDNLLPYGDDDPDYHADIHLGRIPFSSPHTIEDICNKTIAFDSNKDRSYKEAALLAGSIYYFENENYSGNDRLDGADFVEELLDDGVFERSNSVYLYEEEGLEPCPYPCTAPLTRANMIGYWQQKGFMYECHHGSSNTYARKVWAWDDGDSVPEWNEIQWPTCLNTGDVYQLDNTYPATTFLRSCLCGKPEVSGLGAYLLFRGSSAVISSSRVAWMTHSDPGGMPYHFYERLMIRPVSSRGLIGKAYDLARCDFMEAAGFWLPAYHYNLFGDPALRQFGRVVFLDEKPIGGLSK